MKKIFNIGIIGVGRFGKNYLRTFNGLDNVKVTWICATKENTKCDTFFDKTMDGLHLFWSSKNWCNPPHDENEAWVKMAYHEFLKHKETMMIIPANSLCTNYAEECIETHAEYHPINRKFCKFLYKGEEKGHSRNGYFVVIWRKR